MQISSDVQFYIPISFKTTSHSTIQFIKLSHSQIVQLVISSNLCALQK